ncbi:MAG: uroporphyrinogen decarboxylase [Candidatus Tectomicrobia bacterium]|uniref:Uroporphyrinogen decarboxylase n=1 Tax=Tectimicrobiota bacterium TaxID=2528274 RepID=A0A932CPA3_UNCTE|nr:uroporphyrinogen decarboxylase [Candidatus Tectomicrobia bacterium]
MNKRERLQAALAGEPLDRPPVAFWRHFPGDDQDPQALAQATLAFQQRYDFDFVKVTPSSAFSVEDWGVETTWRGNQEGTREYLRRRIQKPQDWRELEPLDVHQGTLGGQLHCLRQIKAALGEETPFLQTIFNPLAVARYLRGEDFLVDLRRHPELFRAGLETITDTIARFTQAALEAGADGIFLAVQQASHRILSEAEYREFGIPYDRRILEAAQRGWFQLLHLHGEEVFFELLADYPVQAINWHDRATAPSLAEAQGCFRGAVMGGLRQWETLLQGTPEQVRAEVAEALVQTGGRRYLVGAGCVVPLTTPERNLWAAIEAAGARRS